MLGTLRYILDRIRHRKEPNLAVFEEGQAVDAEEVGQAQPNCWFSQREIQRGGIRGGKLDTYV